MPQLYKEISYDPKYNAQQNLSGRTHYAEDSTLSFFHARILDTFETDGGLLFALIESVALDMHNTKRGFRYVIFDIFGHTLSRVGLEESFTTSAKAKAAMWAELDSINAVKATREGIKREKEAHKREMRYLSDTLRELKQAGKV